MTTAKKPIDRRVSVAPMMGWTDRHDRYFLRLLSPHALLYSVMITTGALVFGNKLDLLEFSPEERPVALQLGGAEPGDLARSAKWGQDYGYDEINLNCGCPSDRVQRGRFGACLMAEPALVADCVDAMRQAVDIPVTVKTRIGIDHQDSYDFLRDFVGTVADKGCHVFIIHARKAWLNGLSPADNRTIPPLDYETVYHLKRDFPHLSIHLNGSIKDIETIKEALQNVDGVMIGRAAYQNPWFLTQIEREVFGHAVLPGRAQIVEALIPYIERMATRGVPLKDITRHILGLYQGMPGARRWRRILSEEACKPAANTDVVRQALRAVENA